MSDRLLRTIAANEIERRRAAAVNETTLREAEVIVRDVRERGESALRAHSERFGDLEAGGRFLIERAELEAARDAIPPAQRAVLERTAERIRSFAVAQRESIGEIDVEIPGGAASQRIAPLDSAACYAPGGRFPLPSSVLMAAVTARAAGVERVWVASPRPQPVTLAAAAIAGADALLAAGGAQAIAALAYGAGAIPAFDIIVGPGNRWVTAAKQLVSGDVRIDVLAGPSELVVVADDSADPVVIAADLLAQAEHDDDALPILLLLEEGLQDAIEASLQRQLADLPTAATARNALRNGFVAIARDMDEAIDLCDRIAPEHLQLCIRDAASFAPRLRHYGGLFVGSSTAEIFGDYGAGPNHVLPTGGTARLHAGLSVFDFLRIQTQLRLDDLDAAAEAVADAVALARMEGLEAHARAAEARRAGRRAVT